MPRREISKKIIYNIAKQFEILLRGMDDNNLIQSAQNGNHEAFEKLYLKHIKLVYGFVYQKTGNREDCEDLTQEIWMNVIKNLKSFEGKSSFKNWLFGIAKHKIMDYYREKYRIGQSPLIEEIFLDENENEDNVTKENKIKVLLASLPENYRTVLELRFLQGYTTNEIAKELKMTVSNVKVTQFRAIKKLKS